MSAFKGRRLVVEVVYDFAKHGGAIGDIDLSDPSKFAGNAALPVGMVVDKVSYAVLVAPTSGGSATISVGDLASTARYLAATAYNNAAFALGKQANAAIGLPVAVASGNAQKPSISVAVAALTAGKMALWLEGYVPKNQS